MAQLRDQLTECFHMETTFFQVHATFNSNILLLSNIKVKWVKWVRNKSKMGVRPILLQQKVEIVIFQIIQKIYIFVLY